MANSSSKVISDSPLKSIETPYDDLDTDTSDSLTDSHLNSDFHVNSVVSEAYTISFSGYKSDIPYQLEVEDSGGSDGNILHKSSLPFDWCFIGAAEDNVHTPHEKVAIEDIKSMCLLYKILMKELD